MIDVTTLFHEYPFLAAFMGTAVGLFGSAIFFLIFGRKLNPMYSSMVKDLGESQKVLIEAHKDALQMQKEHYDHELTYAIEREKKLEASRDEYKHSLHDVRGEFHAYQASTTLQISELQARPNVDQVYRGQQEFFRKMADRMDEQTKAQHAQTEAMKSIYRAIVDHEEGMDKRAAAAIDQIITAVKENGNGKHKA